MRIGSHAIAVHCSKLIRAFIFFIFFFFLEKNVLNVDVMFLLLFSIYILSISDNKPVISGRFKDVVISTDWHRPYKIFFFIRTEVDNIITIHETDEI